MRQLRRDEALLPHPGIGVVESLFDPHHEIIDLRLGDDEGRTEADGVAHAARDDAMGLGALARMDGDPVARLEGLARRLVLDELEAPDQADAARLADERMAAEAPQPLLEAGRHAAHMAKDVALLVDLERLERHRRRDGMAAIGEAVAEGADLLAL